MPPIDRIPPEILITIFLHLRPLRSNVSNPERVPNVLSQVCRLWRTLTLALPALWATLNITCDHHILHPQLHTIHTHLLRSAAHPLSIALNADSSVSLASPPNPHFHAVLAALVAARTRWHIVSITLLVSEATQETLDAITQGDAPLLQSFSCTIEEYEVPLISLPALQGCPQLESLTWHCMLAPLSTGLGDDTWPRLTTLDLEVDLTASDCLTLLQLSPRLSTARFCFINYPSDATSHHILHATLSGLSAVGVYATTVISALTLPALTNLQIYVPPEGRPTILPDILPNLLARSAPPLRDLTISHLGTPEYALLGALALVGGLHSLSARESGPGSVPFTDALVRALHPSPPPAPGPLCPHLECLFLHNLDAPDGVCTDMLWARSGRMARKHGVARLRTVCITLEGDDHEYDHSCVVSLEEDGMEVILASPEE